MYTQLIFVTTQFQSTFFLIFYLCFPLGFYVNIIIVIFDARFCNFFEYMTIEMCINIWGWILFEGFCRTIM